MTICPAIPADAKILTDITQASKAYWPYSPEQLEQWADDLSISPAYIQKYLVFKLVTDGKTCAYYSLHPSDTGQIKLENLFVLPAEIGKGYGKKLLAHAQQESRQLGAKILWLESDPHATEFYLRQGFKITGQKPTTIPGRFLPIMEKQL